MSTDKGHSRYHYVFTGTYSSAGEEAIHTLLFDGETGTLERLNGVSGIDNPSFLTIHPATKKLYAVSETMNGHAVAYDYDESTGQLKELNRQSTRGDVPCHISLDASGKWLLTANYVSGSVCLIPVEADGTAGASTDHKQHTGGSVVPVRQAGPHAHSVTNVPGTNLWLAADLGNDTLYVYRLDTETGKLELAQQVKATTGSGPRHVAFHPGKPIVYVIDELSSTISAYTYRAEDGAMELIQTIKTYPEDFGDDTWCADIHVSEDGAYVYGSNRGHDSIAAFKVREDGGLESVGCVPTQGHWPRNFALAPGGRFLLVGNERSDSIVVMEIGTDGVPVPTGHAIEIAKPACLKFAPAPARHR